MSNNQIDKVSSHGVHSDVTTSGLQKDKQVFEKENFYKLNSLPSTTEMGKKDGAKMNRQQQIAAEKAGAPMLNSQPTFEQDFKLVKNSMVAMLQLLNEIKAELKNFNSFQKDDIKNEKKQWQKSFTEKAHAFTKAKNELESVAYRQMCIAGSGMMTNKVAENLVDQKLIKDTFPQKIVDLLNNLENLSPYIPNITNKETKLPVGMVGVGLTQWGTKIGHETQLTSYTLEANQTMTEGMKDAHRMTYDAAKEFDQQVSGAIEHLNQTITELIRIEAKAYESRG